MKRKHQTVDGSEGWMHGEMREGRIKNRIPMCNFSERACETAHSGEARNGWMGGTSNAESCFGQARMEAIQSE